MCVSSLRYIAQDSKRSSARGGTSQAGAMSSLQRLRGSTA